jgi:hypothetical protein
MLHARATALVSKHGLAGEQRTFRTPVAGSVVAGPVQPTLF